MRDSIAKQLADLGLAPPSALSVLLRDFPVFAPLRELDLPGEASVSFGEHPVIETWPDSGGLLLGDRWLLRANVQTGKAELVEIQPEHENLPPIEIGRSFGDTTHLVVVTRYDDKGYALCVHKL